MDSDPLIDADDLALAKQRRNAFTESVPEELSKTEDALPGVIARLNGSVRTKVRKIFAVADQLSEVRKPFVACGEGCSSCCHMNVSITSAEASILSAASGRSMVSVQRAPDRAPDAFAGQPCPFLSGDGPCSVYLDRPLVCRRHSSFFETDRYCEPHLVGKIKAPIVGYSGLDNALFTACSRGGEVVVADIRDFFPALEGG